MVDTIAPNIAASHLEMMTRDGMTPELENGVRALLSQCTTSYNIGSKKFSIWSLLRKNIDAPIAHALHHFGIPELFDGPFSSWLRLQNMAKMSSFLKFNIRLYNYNSRLVADLESIIEISYFTLARKPTRRLESIELRGSIQLNHKKNVDHRHYPHCELCWRLCQAAERNIENPEKTRASLRFCSEHNPSVQNSMYRRDHRFRLRFHEELKKQKIARNVGMLSETEIRVKAYKDSRVRKASLTSEITQLFNKGLKQSEIAKNLGISRQAVSKSLIGSKR